jgi:hypothetical protein
MKDPDIVFENGSYWYSRRGYRHGPAASYNEATKLKARVLARDAALDPSNASGQEANVDVPGVGYTVMSPEQVAEILAPYPGALAGDYAAWQAILVAPNGAAIGFALQNSGWSRAKVNDTFRRADASRGQGKWNDE